MHTPKIPKERRQPNVQDGQMFPRPRGVGYSKIYDNAKYIKHPIDKLRNEILCQDDEVPYMHKRKFVQHFGGTKPICAMKINFG